MKRAKCEGCEKEGIIVDTSAGEIVRAGDVVALAPEDELWLMIDEHGEAYCDDCAETSSLATESPCLYEIPDDDDLRGFFKWVLSETSASESDLRDWADDLLDDEIIEQARSSQMGRGEDWRLVLEKWVSPHDYDAAVAWLMEVVGG